LDGGTSNLRWTELVEAAGLLFVLVNPFLLSIYLLELIRGLDRKTFRGVLVRASCIATAVFVICGLMGDRLFRDVLRLRPAHRQHRRRDDPDRCRAVARRARQLSVKGRFLRLLSRPEGLRPEGPDRSSTTN
jgi:hypothetical protein